MAEEGSEDIVRWIFNFKANTKIDYSLDSPLCMTDINCMHICDYFYQDSNYCKTLNVMDVRVVLEFYESSDLIIKRKYIIKGPGNIRIGKDLFILAKVPFGLRRRPNSALLNMFMEDFLSHAKDAQLPIDLLDMSIIIEEENRTHDNGHGFLFISDIEFISPNKIQAGHRSASAAVDMITSIREYSKEHAEDLELLRSLGISIELDIDLLPTFYNGLTLYYDFVRNLATELKNRQITRNSDFGKMKVVLELIVTGVKDTVWGNLHENLYRGLINFPNQNVSYIKEDTRIQVGHESYTDLIYVLLNDTRFDFIEGPSPPSRPSKI